MEALDRLFSFDLRQLAQAGAAWPWWTSAPILVIGLLMAGYGSRGPLRHATMALAAGTVGWLLFARIPGWIPGTNSHWGGAVALGAAGMLVPRFGAFAAGALVGSAIAATFAPGNGLASLSFMLVTSIGCAAAARRIAAVASALVGATMTTVAAIALLPDALRASLAAYPAAPLLPLVVIACAGAAFQIGGGARKKQPPEKKKHEPYADDVAARRAA